MYQNPKLASKASLLSRNPNSKLKIETKLFKMDGIEGMGWQESEESWTTDPRASSAKYCKI